MSRQPMVTFKDEVLKLDQRLQTNTSSTDMSRSAPIVSTHLLKWHFMLLYIQAEYSHGLL